MLVVVYYSYSMGMFVLNVWFSLYMIKCCNFFVYLIDVVFLMVLVLWFLLEFLECVGKGLMEIIKMIQDELSWFFGFDGLFFS